MLSNVSLSLTGKPLVAWLDQMEETIEQKQEENLPTEVCQQFAAKALKQETFLPDSLESLDRLQKMWMYAGLGPEAVSLIDRHALRLLNKLSDEERYTQAFICKCWRIEALALTSHQNDWMEAIQIAAQHMSSLTYEHQWANAWLFLIHQAKQAKCFEWMRTFAQHLHALMKNHPERAHLRAWDATQLIATQYESFVLEEEDEQATQTAQKMILTLKKANTENSDQDIDFDDWIHFGERLVEHHPEMIHEVISNARSHLEKVKVPAIKRSKTVRQTRLEAKALFYQDRLNEAIEKGKKGYFALSLDEGRDAFGAELLSWLEKAGRTQEVASMALELICDFDQHNQAEKLSSQLACNLAFEKLQNKEQQTQDTSRQNAVLDDQTRGIWHLVLAAGELNGLSLAFEHSMDSHLFFWDNLGQAEKYAPNHPALLMLKAKKWIAQSENEQKNEDPSENQDEAKTKRNTEILSLLEELIKHPKYLPVIDLIRMRFRVYGVENTLKLPFVAEASATANYQTGTAFSYLSSEPPKEEAPFKEAISELGARFLEQSVAQFEAFFASGEGAYNDASAHTYAMLCNNLGIYYNFEKKDFERALVLHQRGFEASPFAENCQGIMNAYIRLEKSKEIVESADMLWNFAINYGYSRHNPYYYFDDVAWALHALNRSEEISIWLKRIEAFHASLSDEEAAQNESRFWDVSLILLGVSAKTVALRKGVLNRLTEMIPKITALNQPRFTRLIGWVFDRLDFDQDAVHWYQRALNELEKQPNEKEKAWAENRLKICQEQLNKTSRTSSLTRTKSRSWWKFWA